MDTTHAVVGGAFTDVASAEAAGYVWIGDGRREGTYQHYINHAYLADGRELDPEHIESLVFEDTAEGPVLVTTMYVLEVGSTMADVPDVAGDLTVWHDHQNLCWDESGTRLAGVSTDGKTASRGHLPGHAADVARVAHRQRVRAVRGRRRSPRRGHGVRTARALRWRRRRVVVAPARRRLRRWSRWRRMGRW